MWDSDAIEQFCLTCKMHIQYWSCCHVNTNLKLSLRKLNFLLVLLLVCARDGLKSKGFNQQFEAYNLQIYYTKK